MKKYWLAVFLCLFLLPYFCFAEKQNSSEQLQKIRERIEQTSENLEEQKTAEKDLLRDLSVVATTIKQIDHQLKSLKKDKRKITESLAAARLELQEAQREINDLEKQVNKRLVALYKEGETGALKLFFSSDSPMEVAQQYQYLSLVLDHDRKLLADFRKSLEQKRDKSRRYEQLQTEQRQLLVSEQKSRDNAAQGRKLYNEILKRVRLDKKKLAQELKKLENRARRLEKLVQRLKAEQTVQQNVSQKTFTSLKGTLSWPVTGSVSVGYGTQHSEISGSVLESHGIEIVFKEPQAVKAVAAGRIVFASWFKGYGNLMIIAHDEGYHTLYAQVEKLQGDPGDVVIQGEVIAQTGTPQVAGLYFEIRHNGTPIDPISWLVPK